MEEERYYEEEVISAELTFTGERPQAMLDFDIINREVQRVDAELTRYTNTLDKSDYAMALGSGILAGIVDAVFVGDTSITENDIKLSHEKVNRFIQAFADARGLDGSHLKSAIIDLEDAFKAPQDNVWKGAKIGVSSQNHHLADIAHHPTPGGLMASLVTQFLRVGIFVNPEGEWHFVPVETHAKDLAVAPALLTGLLNWLVTIGGRQYEAETESKIPKSICRIARLIASTPMLIEVVKCVDNWFGHLVSDMGGSKNTPGAGMGIPGMFLSILYELASLPGFKNTGLPKLLDNLYQKQKFDLRHELPLYKAAGAQAFPIIFNEIIVRTSYFMTHLARELNNCDNVKDIDWNKVVPIQNRTVGRMITISTMTFTVADTADAAIHAAIESGGKWVLFPGRFVTRFNYVGAGKAVMSIVKEVSSEKKEAQLIQEKVLLSEATTALFLEQLQDFKARLEERVSNYLAEDISEFMSGFDYMQQGLTAGDSNLVIHGNVIIQKVLGREPQFTNQQEFDVLMDSDVPLTL